MNPNTISQNQILLDGISRFVPNPRFANLTDKLDKIRDEMCEAT